jgi:hypothetical protein
MKFICVGYAVFAASEAFSRPSHKMRRFFGVNVKFRGAGRPFEFIKSWFNAYAIS